MAVDSCAPSSKRILAATAARLTSGRVKATVVDSSSLELERPVTSATSTKDAKAILFPDDFPTSSPDCLIAKVDGTG